MISVANLKEAKTQVALTLETEITAATTTSRIYWPLIKADETYCPRCKGATATVASVVLLCGSFWGSCKGTGDGAKRQPGARYACACKSCAKSELQTIATRCKRAPPDSIATPSPVWLLCGCSVMAAARALEAGRRCDRNHLLIAKLR